MKELRKITQKQLEEILHKHKLWLENKEGGEKADLSYVDLAGADLTGANLIGADLEYANLTDADLECANLMGANLMKANLTGTNLTGVYLEDTNLEDAILEKANLTNTILQDTTPNENKEDTKEENKVLETNSMDFNKVFDVFKYVIDNKNVNEIIITEDKIEIKINS